VDDRLIHGQTLVAWCPTLKIQEIIAVDDAIAQNPVLKSIMTMSVPKNYQTSIVTVNEAKELLKEESGKNRLLILKSASHLQELKEEITGCDEIILGNLAKRENTPYNLPGAAGMFYLSDEDVNTIDQIVSAGIQVTFQQMPNSAFTKWETFRKSIK